MPPRKSRPPITYANTLDKKPKAKLAPKQTKSPQSARPDFREGVSKPMQNKARRANTAITLNASLRPEPKLQPKGMGEHGVNWNAHLARLQKAKKAVKINRTASKYSFEHNRTAPSRER
mgnify:CR=1 FL=1